MIPRITHSGINVMTQALDGQHTIVFTRMAAGNGDVPADYKSLNNLVNPVISIPIDSITVADSNATLVGIYSNNDLQTTFTWTEVGIFCQDPDNSSREVLYAYGHYVLDEVGEPEARIPASSTQAFEIKLTYTIFVGEISDIRALIPGSLYATKQALQDHIDDTDNPHKVSKEQVGLGNVPNVATNDQTPTYTPGATAEELVSGETLSTAFGKIAGAIRSLLYHLRDTVSHISDYERSNWNSKAEGDHKHSATDITSGVLPVERGGTGYTSPAQAAREILKNGVNPVGGDLTFAITKGIRSKDSTGEHSPNLIKMGSKNEVHIGPEPGEGCDGHPLHIHSGGGYCIRTYSGVRDSGEPRHFHLMADRTGNFYPSSNNQAYTSGHQDFGSSEHRWKTVYCTSTDTSSDKKLKNEIGAIDKAKEIIMGLNPVEFSWKNDTEERPLMGFYAQEVFDLMQRLGVKNSAVYKAGYSIQTGVDEDGTKYEEFHNDILDEEIRQMDDKDLSWGLDYIQLIAPMIKVIQEQETRIGDLEKRIKEVH